MLMRRDYRGKPLNYANDSMPLRQIQRVIFCFSLYYACCSCSRHEKTVNQTKSSIEPPGQTAIDDINRIRLEALTHHGDKSNQIRELLAYAADQNIAVRSGAFAAIGSVAPVTVPSDLAAIIGKLRDGLNDPSRFVRREAAISAGEYGDRAADLLPDLLKAATDNPDSDIAVFSVESIGKIGVHGDIVVPRLISIAVAGKNAHGRMPWEVIPTVKALAAFKDYSSQITDALEVCLVSTNEEYMDSAADTIVTLNPNIHSQLLDDAISKMANAKTAFQRMNAVMILGKISSFSSNEADLISKLATDSNPAVKAAAVKVVSSHKG